MSHWLMKSEPGVFGIDDLERERWTPWDGVRNYQARNFLRAMRRGDTAFLYHSSCAEPAIVGIMNIVREAYPEPGKPQWVRVDVAFERRLRQPVTLAELRKHKALAGMTLLRRGNRLSVMPVSEREWASILDLE